MIIIVQHKVRDYDAWKSVFDEHQAVRTRYGATSHELYRGLEDPNDITVVNHFPSKEQAEASAAAFHRFLQRRVGGERLGLLLGGEVVDDRDVVGIFEPPVELMAGGAVPRAYGLVLVEDGLPSVVVTYLMLNDDDHDRLSSETGAPLLSRSARLPAIVCYVALLRAANALGGGNDWEEGAVTQRVPTSPNWSHLSAPNWVAGWLQTAISRVLRRARRARFTCKSMVDRTGLEPLTSAVQAHQPVRL